MTARRAMRFWRRIFVFGLAVLIMMLFRPHIALVAIGAVAIAALLDTRSKASVRFMLLFATLAAWTRIYPDIFGQLAWIDFRDMATRRRIISILAWTIPLCWAATFLFIELPVAMILFGGVVGSVMLFLVALAAIHLKRTLKPIESEGWFYTFAFWMSIASIAFVAVYGLRGLL